MWRAGRGAGGDAADLTAEWAADRPVDCAAACNTQAPALHISSITTSEAVTRPANLPPPIASCTCTAFSEKWH